MKRLLIISMMGMMTACGSGEKKVPGIDPANFDLSVAPNEDFYEYATGGWQKANPLKPEFARYGSFDVLRENNEIRIRDLFASMEGSTAAAGSVEQKIGDLYRLGLDSVRLNTERLEPIAEDLAAIASSLGRDNLSRLLGTMHRSTGSPFFSIYVTADMMDSGTNMVYLSQDGLGMGNRDYYLDAENESIRTAYRAYIEKLFTMAGYGDPAEAVEAVMEIETRIAQASLSTIELRDPYNSYNKMTIEAVKADYPAIDWDAYLGALKLSGLAEINVSHPKVMRVADEILAGDRAKLNYYLAFNILDGAAGYLDDDAQNASFEFYGRTMSGQEEQRPRWKRALAIPNSTLGEAVGEMYVAKYFSPQSKARMLQLVGDLQVALGEHIDALEWMSDETKQKAHEKLSTFIVKIGYPDKWKDYSTLTIDPALSYWQNLKRARAWQMDDMMAKAGKPVDRAEWFMSPQTVNAYYNPTTNEICFPAAILQPPFFNPDADDAVNYGAIGVVIGHEMTHGFDDMGRQFDKDGNLNEWWTAADAEAFNKRADVLVAQYDKIEVLPGLKANGRFSLGENIADQGGLRVAYTAMKNRAGASGDSGAQGEVAVAGASEPVLIDGFTPDQRFYLAYAQLWAQNIRDEEAERLTKIDEHSLGKWRVDGALKNIDTFYTAFGITDGAMFLPPSERVVIW
jgi:putative endopeptidase